MESINWKGGDGKLSKLNPRQQKFADEYIISSNAEQSAIKAGYSEKYARGQAYKLLANIGIQSYMQEKTRQLQLDRHLSMEEALALTASIAKGEPQKFVSKEIDPQTGEVLLEELKEFSAGFKERNQALEHFYKINSAFVDKKEVDLKTSDIQINIGDYDDD